MKMRHQFYMDAKFRQVFHKYCPTSFSQEFQINENETPILYMKSECCPASISRDFSICLIIEQGIKGDKITYSCPKFPEKCLTTSQNEAIMPKARYAWILLIGSSIKKVL